MDIPARRAPIQIEEAEPIEMWTYDERLIASAVIDEIGGIIRYQGKWYTYDVERDSWTVHEDEAVIASAILSVLDRTYMLRKTGEDGEETKRTKVPIRSTTANSILQVIQWMDGVKRSKTDLPMGYLALADGMLNVTTRLTEPYQRRFVPVRIGITCAEANKYRGQRAELWESFLREGFDERTYSVVQEFVGYGLMEAQPFQKALWIYGRAGCGKGTILDVLKYLVGEGNYWSGRAADLSNRYVGGAMLNKALILIPDFRANRDEFKGLPWMLSVIGGDSVTVEDKYEKSFSALVQGKTLIGSNFLPTIPDDTGAIARRLIVVQRTALEDKEEDPWLRDRLRAELPQILHWACDGLQRLLARGRFDSKSLDPVLQEHAKAATNTVYAWARDRLDFDAPDATKRSFLQTSELFQDYRAWLAEQNIRDTKSQQDFVVSLKSTFGSKLKADRKFQDGAQKRGFYGAKLKEI